MPKIKQKLRGLVKPKDDQTSQKMKIFYQLPRKYLQKKS